MEKPIVEKRQSDKQLAARAALRAAIDADLAIPLIAGHSLSADELAELRTKVIGHQRWAQLGKGGVRVAD